jgi:alkylated DNA repair dioxygenase AlkB
MNIVNSNGCFICLEENFLSDDECDQVLQEGISCNPEQKQINIYGRLCNQKRLVKLFAVAPDFEYTYSGLTLSPVSFPPTMKKIRRRLEDKLGVQFPICLLNFYRNGNDYISPHSDDETELGPTPTIASISVGAERKLVLQHIPSKKMKEIILPNGSLFLMAGRTQQFFKHGVPKDKECLKSRVNLTFRTYRNIGSIF